MTEKEKIINAFNNAWNKKIASENSYGKLASKEMFENKKEIIIDCVNVAECISFDKNNGHNICCYDDIREDKIPFANFCVENKNCYYKQLKRLEQENKELRQQYNCYACDTCQGKEDYRNMKRHCENAIKTVHTYRSALEEIKEDIHSFYVCEDSSNDYKLEDIINKINEVLE